MRLDQGVLRQPSLADALVPLATLALLIGGSLALFGLDALAGPVQVALVLCAGVAALVAVKNGHAWSEVQVAGQGAMASVTSAVFILLAVGALIGTWNLSGTIPTLVYYGIQVLSPGWYYAATAVISAVVALSIGSSWTTAGTIGVGLVGIATMLGVSPAITAGAVISGAYLGDKTSPLSETTILTAQMVKVDVYDHIKRQVWTSVPAYVVALAVFFVLGLAHVGETEDTVSTTTELAALSDVFWISPVNLLPLVLLAYLSVRKVPASLALMASALFAGALAAFTQPDVVAAFVSGTGNVVVESIKAVWQAMATGFDIDTGLPEVDQLVSRGGMDSMLLTLWLIFGAVTFGALLEHFGLISRLVDPMIASATEHRTPVPDGVRVRVRPQRGGRGPVHRAGAAGPRVPRSSSPGAASPRPTCPGWPPTAAPSPRPSCRGTRAGPSWAPPSASPPSSTRRTPSSATPVRC